MTPAKFNNSLNNSIRYLKEIELFKKKNVKEIGKHSSIFKKISRKKNHGLIHTTAIENLDWEIILIDNSIYQFSFDSIDSLRYAFIQNPNTFVTKNDFLMTLFEEKEIVDNYDELIAEIKENEFEQFQIEQDINSEAHIIRYDYDSKNYKKLTHSASHLHIGFSESMRIPIKSILTPLEFVFFTVRHSYSDYWESSFNKIHDFEAMLLKEKNICPILTSVFWHNDEESDLFIS